jgi:hypothetical protein
LCTKQQPSQQHNLALMGRIKDYFTSQGLAVGDIPLALLYHEVISVAFAAAVWSACYQVQPALTLSKPFGRVLPPAARAKTASLYTAALGAAEKQVIRQAWLRKLPIVRSAEPQRLVVSLAESLVTRGAMKPITFVGKLWLSYEAVLFTKRLFAPPAKAARKQLAVSN